MKNSSADLSLTGEDPACMHEAALHHRAQDSTMINGHVGLHKQSVGTQSSLAAFGGHIFFFLGPLEETWRV